MSFFNARKINPGKNKQRTPGPNGGVLALFYQGKTQQNQWVASIFDIVAGIGTMGSEATG
tara:strand:+ start:298 stop:477 length:180 start_codon:yes stop_codon:yes gene_type:complete